MTWQVRCCSRHRRDVEKGAGLLYEVVEIEFSYVKEVNSIAVFWCVAF